MVQLSTLGRVVTGVAISDGVLQYFNAGDTIGSTATNNSSTTPPFDTAVPVIYSAPNNGKLWISDGFNYRFFDPTTNIVDDWTASAGSMPVDTNTLTGRIIETWRGRTVVTAVVGLPYSWFMSRVGNSRDFDYAPVSPGPADAVSSETGPQGITGDVITGFVPYTDDVAFLGCNNHLYIMNGDPQAGGEIDLVSDRIGMAYGRAWCKDAYGTLYFFSNRCGIYSITPGQQPQRISQSIDPLLVDINSGANIVCMEWNDKFQGFHVWITSTTDTTAAATHYFWEQRTNAWFQVVYNQPLHNPRVCCQFDGNTPEDRVVLIGSMDGVVRFEDPNAPDDDGRPIDSSVVLTPLMDGLNQMNLREFQAVLGADSGDVDWNILLGTTAEEALAQGVQESGTFTGGRNETQYLSSSSHFIYMMLTSVVQWRMEQIRAVVETRGRIWERAKG